MSTWALNGVSLVYSLGKKTVHFDKMLSDPCPHSFTFDFRRVGAVLSSSLFENFDPLFSDITYSAHRIERQCLLGFRCNLAGIGGGNANSRVRFDVLQWLHVRKPAIASA